MIKCSNCNKEMDVQGRFCIYCGNPITDKKLCSSCGTNNTEGAKFCGSCGTRFEKGDEAKTEKPMSSSIPVSKPTEPQYNSSNPNNENIVYCDPFWQEERLRENLGIFSTNFDAKIQLNEIEQNVFEVKRVFEGTYKRVSYRAIVKIGIDPEKGNYVSFEYFKDDPSLSNKARIFWDNYYKGLKKLFSMSYDDIMTQEE